jgi:hypothetical protein
VRSEATLSAAWLRNLGVVGVVGVVVTVGVLAVVGVAPAGAGTSPPASIPTPTSSATTTTLPEPGQGVPGNIIPEPNSGIAPEKPGDRGSWEQWAVLGAIVGGIAVIVVFVVRDSRRKRAARAP